MNNTSWNSVKVILPDSDIDDEYEVLCITAKYADPSKYYTYEILSYVDGIWLDRFNHDFENNADLFFVTHWCKLPDFKKIFEKI